MTKEQAIEEINKAFEPAFANYIITALTEGATVSDKALEQQPCGHITCKCCKYWIEEKHRKDDLGVCVCFSKAHVTCHLTKDFYCKFAERKEEE